MSGNRHLEDEKSRLEAYVNAVNVFRDTLSDPCLEANAHRMAERLDSRIEASKRKHLKIRNVTIAFSAACAVLLFGVVRLRRGQEAVSGFIAYENTTGSVQQFSLPDGSSVILADGTSLSFIYKDGIRLAALDGSCYFDIAKDSLNPFVVSTKGVDIKVLGTSFSVNAPAHSPRLDVTLERGSVRLLDKHGAPLLRLIPNQRAVLDTESGDMSVEQVFATPLIQQQYSLVVLDNASVDEILSAVESVYGIKVKASGFDPSNRYRISFSRTEPLGNVLNVLELLTGGHYFSDNVTE